MDLIQRLTKVSPWNNSPASQKSEQNFKYEITVIQQNSQLHVTCTIPGIHLGGDRGEGGEPGYVPSRPQRCVPPHTPNPVAEVHVGTKFTLHTLFRRDHIPSHTCSFGLKLQVSFTSEIAQKNTPAHYWVLGSPQKNIKAYYIHGLGRVCDNIIAEEERSQISSNEAPLQQRPLCFYPETLSACLQC